MADKNERPECIFKEKCYRRNPHHFMEYKHDHLAAMRLGQIPVVACKTLTQDQLKEQLKVYCDVEKSFERKKNSSKDQPTTTTNVVFDGGPGTNEKKEPRNKDLENRAITNTDRESSKREKPTYTSHSKGSPKSDQKRAASSSPPNVDKKLKTENSLPGAAASSSAPGGRKSKIEAKLVAAAPFNFFLTKVKDNPATHSDNYSVYMTDLLHPSLGKIKSSLQINFMVELDWLMMNYEVTKNDKKPLVILYGQENPELASPSLPSNIRAIRVKPKYPYGTHHTKMMVFCYEDNSVRVVVHTANLYSSDWENRTQGVWVSPSCPKMANADKTGDSPTQFKSSLLRYLKFYEVTALKQFTDAISMVDMSAINVALIASVPNSHQGPDLDSWGQRALGRQLARHVNPLNTPWPVTIQCSSIGSLGQTPDVWLEKELGRNLSMTKGGFGRKAEVQLVYPSHADVMGSYDGPLGGGCLPYSGKTHTKQLWLTGHCHHWRADGSDRSRAMPHIKTYTRVSPDSNEMAYFLLTSANLSKAAWGSTNKAGNSQLVMSYEAGVLFLPKFITGEDRFRWTSFRSRSAGSHEFPVHHDLPPKPYDEGQKPWLYDFLLK